jgi:hypothetical protein
MLLSPTNGPTLCGETPIPYRIGRHTWWAAAHAAGNILNVIGGILDYPERLSRATDNTASEGVIRAYCIFSSFSIIS